VLWEDNYIELMPGESREITAQFPASGTLGGDAELSVTGWNITSMTLALGR
jgi:exo-1,4-beta-D-glucosaminidase